MATVSNRAIGAELAKRGLLPDNCRLISLDIAPDGATVVRYERYITTAELSLVADALKAIAGEVSS